MNDDELRAMVRESLARHLNPGAPSPHEAATPPRLHPSHVMLPLSRGGDGEGACLIEPGVRCNHCGYCLSYGH